MASAGKKAAAQAAVNMIKSHNRVGMGTGSTVAFAIEELAAKLKAGTLKDIACVPTSEQTRKLLEENNIPVLPAEFAANCGLDIAIDGADEVDPTLALIKGGGGALLREKVVAGAAKRFVVIVDESKLSEQLGTKFHLPVEVVPFAVPSAVVALRRIFPNAEIKLRNGADGAAYVTDNGLNIVEVHSKPLLKFADEDGLLDLGPRVASVPGVADHGLFVGMATEVLIGMNDGGVKSMQKGRTPMMCQ